MLEAHIDALTKKIAALEAEKAALLAEAQKPWPKKVILSALTDSVEHGLSAGQIGLSSEAVKRFRQSDELELEYSVESTGAATLLTIRWHGERFVREEVYDG